MSIKKQLYQQLQQQVDQRVSNAQKAMKAAEDSKNNETKSSAGDKFETSRAMMQGEEERNKIQLVKAVDLQRQLAQIDITKTSKIVVLGSIVYSNQGNYFLSIGLGKIVLEDTTYFAISLASPIGQLLFGKSEKKSVKYFFRPEMDEKTILRKQKIKTIFKNSKIGLIVVLNW